MILSVVVILLVGLIAYMHYVQGLLSGLISAVLALLASAMAMSYYEPLARTLSGGKFNDTAQGICLLSIFAGVYLITRVIFDKFVPGNVRVPFIADKIGGAVMGLLAGLIAMGMIVIALQMMPFGPSIAGYSRFELDKESPRHVAISNTGTGSSGVDRVVVDQTKEPNLDKDTQGLMLMPVDDLVVGITKRLSNGGALSTGNPFASVHPDLLQELFGQRLGLEAGTKHTASNAKDTQVFVEQINVLPTKLPWMIGEFSEINRDAPKGDLAASSGHKLISVTIMFGKDAADEGFIMRVSPGNIRLVAKTHSDPDEWSNFFPIGTVQMGKAWNNRIDDFMFFDLNTENRGAHFIFDVDDAALEQKQAVKGADGKITPATYTIAPDTFIEVKRLVKLPLEGVKIENGLPPDAPKYRPIRKTRFFDEKTQTAVAPTTPTPTTPTPTTPTPPTPDPATRVPTTPTPTTPTPTTPTPPATDGGWGTAPLERPIVVEGNRLPVGIGVGSADADVLSAGASGHLTNKQFDTLEVDPSAPEAAVSELPKAGNPVQELAVPAGKRMVQVLLNFKPGVPAWATSPNVADYTVLDATGAVYKPSGVVTRIGGGPTERLLASYKSTGGDITVKKVDGATPAPVVFIYLIPTGQKATELRYQGKPDGLPLEK